MKIKIVISDKESIMSNVRVLNECGFCTECGAEIFEEFNYCDRCGAELKGDTKNIP